MDSWIITPSQAMLLIVDIQERLHAAMEAGRRETYVKNTGILIKTAQAFGMPVLVSEQYPRGLGRTIPEVSDLIPDAPRLEKLDFSCWREESLRQAISQAGRPTVIVTGIETHVCVFQTVLDLRAAGYRPVVATDAVCSRFAADRETAVHTMMQAGALCYSTEMISFMLLEKAGTAEFKQISPLYK